jgi:hypothetical protein
MVSVGVVVEARHLAKAGAAVERNRLTERLVRLEAQGGQAEPARLDFEGLQHAPPDPEPAGRVGDPHPLQRAQTRPDRLHCAAGHGLAVHRGDQERAAGRDQVAIAGRQAGAGVEAGLEAPIELGEIPGDAAARRRTRRVDALDAQARHAEQPLHLRRRRDQRLALFRGQGAEQLGGRPVGARVHLPDLTSSCRRQLRLAHPPIPTSGTEPQQALSRQRPGQPADVAGVEPQTQAQLAEVGALRPDLVEQARGAEGTSAPQEVVLESAGPLGDEPVEAP